MAHLSRRAFQRSGGIRAAMARERAEVFDIEHAKQDALNTRARQQDRACYEDGRDA